ncbi:MAG: NAD(P)-dependent oxidoreductase [Bdellovibrionales bacterium]|nr:NAD(P)-dependent oxidoreductase [Bdellovibrionales bacterium]
MSESEPLVTLFGGAGYIGCHLVRQLLEQGYRVRVFDCFLFGNDGLAGLDSPNLEVIEGDICDTNAVSSACKGSDCVVLLAAIVGHRIRDVRWTNTRSINFLASTVVLDAAIEHGASHFIFASTNSVYGTQSGVMYETAIPQPVSLYARLKLRMEERVMKSKRSSFHPTVLRIATCYGFSPRMRFDLAPNTLIRDAVCNKQIHIENGEQSRSLIHVEDAARAFSLCIGAHANLVSGEIFNVGAGDQNLQVNQLANLVKTLVPDISILFTEGEADLTEYRLSCTKIEKVLDFTPQWTLEQGLTHLRDCLIEGQFEDPFSLKYHNT